MRSNTKLSLQMLCVHNNTNQFISVFIQAKQNTAAYIINPSLHGTVHRLCMVRIITFWPCRMQFFVSFFIISLLKQNISSNPCIFEFLVIFNRSRCNIYIDTTNRSIFVLNAVYRTNTLQNVLKRIILRVFARFYRQTLMPHILQRNYFLLNFFLRQFFSCNMFIFYMIRTVHTTVNTVIG